MGEIIMRSNTAVDAARSGLSITAKRTENIDAVRQSLLESLHRFARTHATALGLSAPTMD